MDTRTTIIQISDSLIRERGYNAFSFSDISKKLHIKNASVHYHFPTKTSLGIAVIQEHWNRLEQLKHRTANQTPLEKLNAFFSIYSTAKSENKVCIVGSLATDLFTLDPGIQNEIKKFTNNILKWVTKILQEGKSEGIFNFNINERTKALIIITNMLAAVQLARLTNKQDFQRIKDNVLNDLIQYKP